jgi:pyridoxal phosphate enzyme (YggS family)
MTNEQAISAAQTVSGRVCASRGAVRGGRDKIIRMSISVLQETINANFLRINECIKRSCALVGRHPSEVTLMGVSKTHPVESIRAAYVAGVRHFGENRLQEYELKSHHLKNEPHAVFHFIGHLQSNKALKAVQLFNMIDSVDSLDIALKIDRAVEGVTRIPILLEVRMDDAVTKTGFDVDAVQDGFEILLGMPHLDIRGLMCIPPFFEDPTQARVYFRGLRNLRDAMVRRFAIPLPTLSMGMSHDFEVAIEEGSTEVRLGTALFGARLDHHWPQWGAKTAGG